MCRVRIHLPDGSVKTTRADRGTLLKDLIDPELLDMPCGGAGRCGKCKVRAEGALSEPGEEEKTLSGGDLENGIRLACRTCIAGNAEIFLQRERAEETIRGDGVMPSFAADPLFTKFGAAVDIGTTTLASRLYDHEGCLTAQAASSNPQRRYGADVISRIGKSLEGERTALASCVREEIDHMILSMAGDAGVDPGDIDAVVITGNTTMLYLLTERDPECLSRAPFIADELVGRFAEPEELTLPSVPEAKIYLAGCISAFVGADITTALLAAGICGRSENALMADIGTNGELALWDGKTLRCCSTAAGPVFEGAEISQGMSGRPGAIDHVRAEDGEISCHVIGGGKAEGICGSGIIDACAVMCDEEIIDETGYMEDEVFELTPEVSVTQKDVRMVQLAKSAICAGIHTLLSEASFAPGELAALFIAGGFGSFLDVKSAARIGLYPPEFEEKAVVIGNAALSGASMILLRKEFMEQAASLAEMAGTVELSTNKVFMEKYIDCMEF